MNSPQHSVAAMRGYNVKERQDKPVLHVVAFDLHGRARRDLSSGKASKEGLRVLAVISWTWK